MKITILGSGGGEALPALWCNCPTCRAARKKGGKDVRSLSQTLVGDDLLLDMAWTAWHHVASGKLPLYNIKTLLVTHKHSDHFSPGLFDQRGCSYAHDYTPEIEVCGSADAKRVYDLMDAEYKFEPEIKEGIKFRVVRPLEKFRSGKYEITALPARHAPNEQALNYIVDDGEKRFLYILDSGYPTDEYIAFLTTQKPVDLVIADVTMGFMEGHPYDYHMTIAENAKLKKVLTKNGFFKPTAKWVCTHFTHNSCRSYAECEKECAKDDMIAAYDGMEIEL